MPTRDGLARLAVTRMTLEEAMRLYPPVPFISRGALACDRLAGVEVEAGAASCRAFRDGAPSGADVS